MPQALWRGKLILLRTWCTLQSARLFLSNRLSNFYKGMLMPGDNRFFSRNNSIVRIVYVLG